MAAISKQEDKTTDGLRNASGMNVYGLDNSNFESREIQKEYDKLLRDNEEHYDNCKAELLISARRGHSDLEERGLNAQHFEEANATETDSDLGSNTSVQEISGAHESGAETSPRFFQDTRDISQTDFYSWDPGEE